MSLRHLNLEPLGGGMRQYIQLYHLKHVSRDLPHLSFFVGSKGHNPPAVGFSLIVSEKNKSSLTIAETQDREIIINRKALEKQR